MLASLPASMLNQNRPDLGILNRFNLDPSRSRRDCFLPLFGLLQRLGRRIYPAAAVIFLVLGWGR
jgi:hypothetical protein